LTPTIRPFLRLPLYLPFPEVDLVGPVSRGFSQNFFLIVCAPCFARMGVPPGFLFSSFSPSPSRSKCFFFYFNLRVRSARSPQNRFDPIFESFPLSLLSEVDMRAFPPHLFSRSLYVSDAAPSDLFCRLCSVILMHAVSPIALLLTKPVPSSSLAHYVPPPIVHCSWVPQICQSLFRCLTFLILAVGLALIPAPPLPPPFCRSALSRPSFRRSL